MRVFALRLGLGFMAVFHMLGSAPVDAMTIEQRAALDLAAYVVTAPDAGLFDVRARHAALLDNRAPARSKPLVSEMSRPFSCADDIPLPVITGALAVPGFYTDRQKWLEATEIYHMFQDKVARLAAAQMVLADTYAGECLLKLLDHWAQGSAFMRFDYATSGQQTWFEIGATLSAAAITYSIARELVPGHEAEKHRIETWLVQSARLQLTVEGGKDGACCNNHFYRRALYAALIGVLVDDDDLFRIGVSAIYSALSDSSASGNLRLEMKRGVMSAHYQNYAALYLAMIARVIERQGYDPYKITYDGKQLDLVLAKTVATIQSSERVASAAGVSGQLAQFTTNPTFLIWLDLITDRPIYGSVARELLETTQPGYNRAVGGALSGYLANDILQP